MTMPKTKLNATNQQFDWLNNKNKKQKNNHAARAEHVLVQFFFI